MLLSISGRKIKNTRSRPRRRGDRSAAEYARGRRRSGGEGEHEPPNDEHEPPNDEHHRIGKLKLVSQPGERRRRQDQPDHQFNIRHGVSGLPRAAHRDPDHRTRDAGTEPITRTIPDSDRRAAGVGESELVGSPRSSVVRPVARIVKATHLHGSTPALPASQRVAGMPSTP